MSIPKESNSPKYLMLHDEFHHDSAFTLLLKLDF